MKSGRWKFLSYVPFVLAVIASVAVIWLESRANNGQGGCLSMLVLVFWAAMAYISGGE